MAINQSIKIPEIIPSEHGKLIIKHRLKGKNLFLKSEYFTKQTYYSTFIKEN